MRGTAIALGFVGLLHSAAVSQELSSQQMSAITSFATVVVASDVCALELSASAIGDLAERQGLSPDLLYRDPYASVQLAEEERLQTEIASGREAFCQRVWADFGAEGGVEPGVLMR